MKALAPLASAALLVGLAAPAAAHDGAEHAPGVYGLWLTQDGNATVRIAECGPADMAGTPCGTVASADIPEGAPTTDVNNKDESLRGQPIVGLTMLDGFEWRGGKWKRGHIYNPEDGKSYKSSIAVDDDDPDTLKVKGCIGPLCQTQRWTRVEEK